MTTHANINCKHFEVFIDGQGLQYFLYLD